MTAGYLPGDRWLVVTASAAAWLDGTATDALRMWRALSEGASARDAMHVLLAAALGAADGGLARMGPFVLAVREPDGLRVLCRDVDDVLVLGADGAATPVDGHGLIGWAEVVVPTPCELTIGRPGAEGLLPVPGGVVRASAVRWTPEAVAATAVTESAADAATGEPGSPAAQEVSASGEGSSGVAQPEPEPGPGGASGRAEGPAAELEPEAGPGRDEEPAVESEPSADPHREPARPWQPAPEPDEPDELPAPVPDEPDDFRDPEPDEPDELPAPERDERVVAAPDDPSPDKPDEPPAPDFAGLPPLPEPAPLPSLPPFVPAPVLLPPLDGVGPAPAMEETRYDIAVDVPDSEAGHTATDPASDAHEPASVESGWPSPDETEGVPGIPVTATPHTGPGRAASIDPPRPGQAPIVAVPPSIDAPEGYLDRGGDHDGLTQLAEDLPIGYTPPPVLEAIPPGTVLAALCPSGHANAPHSSTCRLCGQPIDVAEPVPVQRPVLARIRLSTGDVIDLDRPVVLGRAPYASRVAASELPRLVPVPSPNQDISRAHAQIRAADWQLVVTDLDSTNGTTVRPPGRAPQRLHPGQEIVVEPGWSVDLGDGISFVVEALP